MPLEMSLERNPEWPSMADSARIKHEVFVQRVGGVMPGYGGHRPGSREVVSKPSVGGVPFKMSPDQVPGQGKQLCNKPTTSWMAFVRGGNGEHIQQDAPTVTDQFKLAIGGVKYGYSGHIPAARQQFGSSHQGGVDGIAPPAPTRGSSWASKQPTDWMANIIPIPSHLIPSTSDPPGYRPPPKRQPKGRDLKDFGAGGIALSYSGHVPMSYDPEPIPEAVGALRHQSTSPPPPPNPSFSHNDWRVVQPEPPATMPKEATQYRQEVGGVLPGYSGFVPGKELHYASSHAGGLHSAAQRGHEKSKLTHLLCESPDTRGKQMSQKAAKSAVGYAGQRPLATEAFGLSYWSTGGEGPTQGDRLMAAKVRRQAAASERSADLSGLYSA